MDLLQNPFYVLKVSPLDMRDRILESAEEQSLFGDPEECSRLCADLMNSRKRLVAEIGWFINTAPERIRHGLAAIERETADLISEIENFSSCEKFNLLNSGLSRKPSLSPEVLGNLIAQIDMEYASIDVYFLSEEINNNRLVSGFPQINEMMVQEVLQERKLWCRQTIKSALNALSPGALVQTVTLSVNLATANGERHASEIIDDLVDSTYEVGAQAFFNKENENIEKLDTIIREYAEAGKPGSLLSFLSSKLIEVVENWGFVAQPIQVSMKSRGLLHRPSKDVADRVRNLSIYLFNEHQKLSIAQSLNTMLQRVFAEVVQVAEVTEEDGRRLQEIANDREEEKKEISYETFLGGIFSKNPFRISPEGIDWEGKHWDLAEIDRIRWGGIITRNGFVSSTLFVIHWGNNKRSAHIETSDEFIYKNIIDRLWKSIGVKIYFQMLKKLSGKENLTFGPVVLFDYGLVLPKWGLFSSSEYLNCAWNEIQVWTDNGAFCISKKDEARTRVNLSYLEVDNVHILEAAIRDHLKTGNDRMSFLLKT